MKNATGSKSVPKAKVVKGTKAKAKAATPAAEVPDWARRAAARNTAAEMAALPDDAMKAAEPIPAQDAAPPSTAATPPKKGRTPKVKPVPANASPKAMTPAAAAAPGSLRAIGDGWLAALRTAGHTPSTISSYGNDLAIAYEHFGEVEAAAITEKQIAAFNASKGVTAKSSGKPKAQPTILKTRRALRLALVWAADQKIIKAAPYAAKTTA